MFRRHRALGALTLGVGAVLVTAGPAGAHVEPDVARIPAGEVATVGFTPEHGCDDAPTTKLEIRVPDAITDAQPVPKEGWTATVDGGVVTFAGGSQASHEPTTYSVTFTAPATAGEELRFPIIQTCDAVELAWIAAAAEADYPAPVVLVGESDAPTTTEPDDVTTTASTSTTEATDAATEDTADTAEDDDGESSTAPLVVGGLLALLVGAGAYVVRARRAA